MISKKTNFVNYSLFISSLDQLDCKKPYLVNTINQYSYCVAEKNEEFKNILENSEILLPDGIAIVWAYRFLTGQKIKKIAGYDVFLHFMNKLNAEKGRCFFLGSSELTLSKIKSNLVKNYPNVTAEFYSPPFKPVFNKEDNKAMIDAVNDFKPDVLFVGMTAPKQEIWSYTFKNEVNADVICAIGAVFDFYAGTIARPHVFWISLNLEWLGRLIKEPKRMWKRYLYYGPVFVYLMLKEKAKKHLQI